MSSNEDILKAISDYLGEAIEGEAQSAPPAPPPEPHQQPPPPRPPRVGTIVQRSDRVNEQKRQMLLAQPPPPPGRRPIRPYEKPPTPLQKPAAETLPREEILRPMGPMTAPLIKVEIEPGLIVEVPHFAVHGTGSSATSGKSARTVHPEEDPPVRPTSSPTVRSEHRA
ncbi:WAS/WASL-interacting protein family member 3-like [Camponotus floridanus]|uniref:WAS/WASL-interacting protein family member 3-like n=1 Tax=Camponotus floridanus TaxID=104421 RepID=UPI000DC6BA57|nr:WAS/WASL-interacting protein family member 3-like [Camponotus floridanus]